jgi:hypothetical protein
MPKTPVSKSDFIRAQPASMSPAEVVAKAKAEGIKLGRSLVYMVRGPSGGKTKKAPAAKKSEPAMNGTGATTLMSKSDFIRSLASSPATEVVAKAKVAGIALSENHVHAVRAKDKANAAKTRKPATRKAVAPKLAVPVAANGSAPSGAAASTASSVEGLLKAVAAEIGLGRALEILTAERARVRAVIAG